MKKTPATQNRSAGAAPKRDAESVGELPYRELPSLSRRSAPPISNRPRLSPHPIGGEIRQTHLAFRKQMHRKLREHNVTSAQWAFLRILWNEDGLNQKDIAQRVGIHPTTAVPAIAILERNGYVRRERSLEDKRNIFVYLTDEGKRLAHELLPFAAEVSERSLAGISHKDADKLMQLLAKIQYNLESMP